MNEHVLFSPFKCAVFAHALCDWSDELNADGVPLWHRHHVVGSCRGKLTARAPEEMERLRRGNDCCGECSRVRHAHEWPAHVAHFKGNVPGMALAHPFVGGRHA